MKFQMRSYTGTAALLCFIATISAMQTLGAIPTQVFADNTLTIQLNRTTLSTEPASASGRVLISLDNGQTKVELHNATPNTTYSVIFALTSVTSTLQVGSLVTGLDGEGQSQTTLRAGTYAGAFSVTRIGIIQFNSNSTLFTVGLNSTVFATISNSTTTGTTTQTIENQTTSTSTTSSTVFQIQPLSSVVNAGDFAKYDIRIVQNPSANVFLVAEGVPPDCIAIFTPNIGVANPEFLSKLTIATSANTPPGTYNIAAIATIDGRQFTDQLMMQINSPVSMVTTQTNTTSPAAIPALSMTVNTDQSQYQASMNVTVQGHVRDNTGNAIGGATIAIQVDAPNGAQLFYTNTVNTDSAGFFQTQLTLPSNAPTGTFTVFSSATKSGYVSATTRSTFVVGVSSTPSVIIKSVYAGDSSGNPSATFTTGQTIWIWVVIQNIGSTFQGVVWIQVRDPNGVPVQIQIHIANLDAGETIKDGLGFTMASNAATGVYTVNALVSDKLISQGGTFLANADTQFDLVG